MTTVKSPFELYGGSVNSSHKKATSAVAKPTKTAPKEKTGPIRQSLISASMPRSLIILENKLAKVFLRIPVPEIAYLQVSLADWK